MRLVSGFLISVVALAASCGGDDGTGEPVGEHYKYVADSAILPDSTTEKAMCSLNVDGTGGVDNKLGDIAATLAQMGFDVQTSLDTSIDQGSIILLTDMQTEGFTDAGDAAMRVFIGDMPTPAACTDVNDTVCRKHLTGSASFSIKAGTPTNSLVNGDFVGGTFNDTAPGAIALQIALTGSTPIQLDVIGAKAKVTGASATNLQQAIFAGAIAKSQVDSEILPAIADQLAELIAEDCADLNTPPACGCMANSTGQQVINLFDADMNCMVTSTELASNGIIAGLLSPDVTINGTPALSIGICTTTAGATFSLQ